MHLFYTPNLIANTYTLQQEESLHCIKVLRLKEGDEIFLTDGLGNLYKTRITIADSRNCEVEVVEKYAEFEKRAYRLHIAIAPTKNIARFEWFLEKATEIGIDEITPVICDHSIRKDIRIDRMQKIITSAMKQSLKAYHPILHQPVKMSDFVKKEFLGQKIIACCNGDERLSLKDIYKPHHDAVIAIGPEGDFSEEEINLALGYNFTPVSLGRSRLRTETAALTVCQSLYFINEL